MRGMVSGAVKFLTHIHVENCQHREDRRVCLAGCGGLNTYPSTRETRAGGSFLVEFQVGLGYRMRCCCKQFLSHTHKTQTFSSSDVLYISMVYSLGSSRTLESGRIGHY